MKLIPKYKKYDFAYPVISPGCSGGRQNYTFDDTKCLFRIPNFLKRFEAFKAKREFYPFEDYQVRLRVCTKRNNKVFKGYHRKELLKLEQYGTTGWVEFFNNECASVESRRISFFQEKDTVPKGLLCLIFFRNPNGEYIGDADHWAFLLSLGIHFPKPIIPDSTCCIGWSHTQHKWFGWSHRACFGFGIGDTVETTDHCCYPTLPVGFTASNIYKARWMAEVFAEDVG